MTADPTAERIAKIRDNDAFAHRFRGAGWPDDATIAEIDRTDLLEVLDALAAERDLLREALAESDKGALILAQWEAIAAADADRDRLEKERDALKAAIERVEADVIEQQQNTGVTKDPWQLGVYDQASRTRRILRDALDAAAAIARGER